MRTYIVPPLPETVWQKPSHFIAFGFGSGSLPTAPGTFGTLLAIPFYLAIAGFSNAVYLAIVMITMLGSMWLCEKVSEEIQIHDHQGMCLDEFIGFLVTMFAVPCEIKWILLGFLLFRLFDIWKPQPIRYCDEKLKGGFGMIFDDVLAGVYSCIVLQILVRIFEQ